MFPIKSATESAAVYDRDGISVLGNEATLDVTAAMETLTMDTTNHYHNTTTSASEGSNLAVSSPHVVDNPLPPSSSPSRFPNLLRSTLLSSSLARESIEDQFKTLSKAKPFPMNFTEYVSFAHAYIMSLTFVYFTHRIRSSTDEGASGNSLHASNSPRCWV